MNVFVLTRGPLQIVTAVEAVEYFELDQSEILTFGTPGAIRLLDDCGVQLGEHIISPARIHRGGSSRIQVQLGLLKAPRTLKRRLAGRQVERFFFGTNGALARALDGAFSARQHPVILEDGTASLRADRRRELLGGRPQDLRARVRHGIQRGLGISHSPIPQLTFFTHLDLDVGDQDRVIANNFSHIRGRLAGASTLDEHFVLILGTYSTKHQQAVTRYYHRVRSLLEANPSWEAIHKPHPAQQSTEGLLPHVQCVDGSTPIELLILDWVRLPGRVVGSGSSALESLRLMLPEAVEFYNLLDV